MTEKQYRLNKWGTRLLKNNRPLFDWMNDSDEVVDLLNELNDKCEFLEIENEALEDGATKYAELYHESLKENEQLKQFIDDLTTKGTGRIDLANGYSYSVSAVLTNWKGDVE